MKQPWIAAVACGAALSVQGCDRLPFSSPKRAEVFLICDGEMRHLIDRSEDNALRFGAILDIYVSVTSDDYKNDRYGFGESEITIELKSGYDPPNYAKSLIGRWTPSVNFTPTGIYGSSKYNNGVSFIYSRSRSTITAWNDNDKSSNIFDGKCIERRARSIYEKSGGT